MIENLIKYYSENLTFYSLVYKKNGYLKNVILWLGVLICVFVIGYFLYKEKPYHSLPVFLFLFMFAKLGQYFNATTIKKYYPDIYISRFDWSTEKINLMIYKKLDAYMENNYLDDNIETIKTLVNKKAMDERVPFFMYSGAFLILFIPLYSGYIDKLLEYFKSDFNALNMVVFSFLVIILTIAFCIPVINSVRDEFLTRYHTLNRLNDLLEEYKLWKECRKRQNVL